MFARGALTAVGLAFAFLSGAPTYASSPQWVSIGPFGGFVGTVHFVPAVKGLAYAVTGEGIFVSTNSGASWVPQTNGIGPTVASRFQPQRRIRDVAFSASLPLQVYAVTTEAVYKLDSASNTWQQIFYVYDPQYGLLSATAPVGGMQVDPFNSQHLVVTGTFPYPAPGQPAGTDANATEFESTDGGASFHMVLPSSSGVRSAQAVLHFAPGRAGLQYVDATAVGGNFLISTDAGQTWHYASSPPCSNCYPFTAFAPSDPDPNRIYAIGSIGTGSTSTPVLYRSDDVGVTWQLQSTLPVLSVSGPNIFMADPVDPDTVYLSTCAITENHGNDFYKTMDGGKTWVQLNGFFISSISGYCPTAAAVDPVTTNHLLAAIFDWGVYSSTDGGQSFIPVNAGLSAQTTQGVAIDNNSVPTLYTGGGISDSFRSTDGGMHWYVFEDGLPLIDALGLPIPEGLLGAGNDWFNPQYAYILTDSAVGVLSPGATAWNAFYSPGIFQAEIEGSPVTPGTLYANSTDGVSSAAVLASTDYGNTWQQIIFSALGVPVPFAPSHKTAGLVNYVASIPNAGNSWQVKRSTDGGTTWAALPGAALSIPCGICTLSLETAVDSDQILYWSDGNSIFKTSDSAATWTNVYSYFTQAAPWQVNGLYADPVVHGNVYGLLATGAVLSTDGGDTWGPMPNPGLDNQDVLVLKHPPWNSSYMLAATNDSGVFSLTTPTNLGVGISGAGSKVTVGVALSYTVTVANQGPVTAQPASLDLIPPVNATLTVQNTGGASCQPVSNGLAGEQICNLPSLVPGASWAVQVGLTVNTAQDGALLAWVTSLQGESDWSDNAATQPLHVSKEVDMSVAVTAASGPRVAGTPAPLATVSVAGAGTRTDSARLFISYDPSVTQVALTPAQPECAPLASGYECRLASVPPGYNQSFTLSGTVTQAGAFSVTAAIAPDSSIDTDGSNNSAAVAQTVSLPPGPTVSTLGGETITAGASMTPVSLVLTGSEPLTISLSSDNAALLPNSAISLSSGCGTTTLNCSVTATPAASQTGVANVTLTAQDAYGQSATSTFSLTVNAAATTSSGGKSGGGGGGSEGLLVLAALLAVSQRRMSMSRLVRRTHR